VHIRRCLLVPSSGGTGPTYITTPPTARKRKASEADGRLISAQGPPQKKQTPDISDLPATPVTNASDKMDSDDMDSSLSGNEFDEDSDLGMEEGIPPGRVLREPYANAGGR